jgi:hypothetical protein
VFVTVGKNLLSPKGKIASFDFLKVDRKLRLPFSGFVEPAEVVDDDGEVSVGTPKRLDYKEVIISIEAVETGRVLTIIPYKTTEDNENQPQISTKKAFTINFKLKAVDISLIIDRPIRRGMQR